MEEQQEVLILICYAPADNSYFIPLNEEFQRLSEGLDYLEVDHIDTANTYPALSRNRTLLQNAEILVILLSNSFLRGTFYRRLLRNNRELRRSNKVVIPLLVHPCQWQHEYFFRDDQEELEEATLLQQVYTQDYAEFMIRQAGQALGEAYVLSRLNYRRAQQARDEAERERRKKWIRRVVIAGKIFSGGLFALLLTIIFYQKILSSEAADAERQRGPDTPANITDSLGPFGEKNFKTQELEEIKISIRGDSTLYKAHHPVGEGRIAALQKEPLGWRLLDTNWLPVNDRLYRRMYYRQGFRRGRMIVKYKDKFYYINPQGQHLPDEVPREYIDLP